MGKSAAAACLRRLGIAVLDTDDVARDVVLPGSEGLRQLCECFGNGILNEDGTLNRAKMANIAFSDPAMRCALEQKLHPLIQTEVVRWREKCAVEGRRACVVVIPLLFECGWEKWFDAVLCLTCSPELQHIRLLHRGMTEVDIRNRIASQMPIAEKVRRTELLGNTGFIIENNGTLDALESQLRQIFCKAYPFG